VNKITRRNFLKVSSVCVALSPLASFNAEQFPRKYHKITKDWSFHAGGVTNWNDFNIYTILGLSKYDWDNRILDEYILRGDNFIYVNKDKCYEATNYKGDFIDKECHFFDVSFDIIKYLGPTPTERIIVISGSNYCFYALGRDYYKEKHQGFTLDRQDIYRPLTEEMHSEVKYFINKKTYSEYLNQYNEYIKNKLI
jgi:hypothetical protein